MNRYSEAFQDFETFLDGELLEKYAALNLSGEEDVLAREVFQRMTEIPLVDKYEAYEALHAQWREIATDLEILQTEGFQAARQVDPRLVVKKKDGRDQEAQEGWMGHVFPFELVQKRLLPKQLAEIKALEDQIARISGDLEALLEELGEEDKEANFITEEKDAFVPAEVKKALKEKSAGAEALAILKKADALFTQEKAVKRQLKESEAALHLKTKAVIEHLSDEQIRELLHEKWICPLIQALHDLPRKSIGQFLTKLDSLCRKYSTTFDQVEAQIAETEAELEVLLDQLQGGEFDIQGLQEFKKMLRD